MALHTSCLIRQASGAVGLIAILASVPVAAHAQLDGSSRIELGAQELASDLPHRTAGDFHEVVEVAPRPAVPLLDVGTEPSPIRSPTSVSWAKEIGADGHAGNAVEAVQVLDSLTP